MIVQINEIYIIYDKDWRGKENFLIGDLCNIGGLGMEKMRRLLPME